MINLLNLGTLTSGFGNRTSPTAGASTNHKGIDIVLNDANIPAVTSGTVTASGTDSSRGNWISIKDQYGNVQTYMHMKNAATLSAGDKVAEGDIIGIMGSTGISTGNHVHFQVANESGEYINPESYFSGATGTLAADNSDDEYGLKWWGDIVKVVLCALLIIAGVAMLVLGVNGSIKKKVLGGLKK